jgi:uncharacterized protein
VHDVLRRDRWRLGACITVVCLVVALWSEASTAADPTVPQPRGYVSDYVGALDAGTVSELDGLIGELKRATGSEIAVVVVGSTAPLDAFDYAMKIAEAWKPGAPGKDNGVVFLVAVKDRKVFILTGYGIEGALPDGKVGEIRDRLVLPAFRDGDYARGIRAGTQALAELIARDAGVRLSGQRQAPPPRSGSPPLGLILVVLVAIILLMAMSRVPRGPAGFGGRRRGFGGPYPGSFGGGFGGGGFGGGGGGFGGFGGGGFGGGGAGGSW